MKTATMVAMALVGLLFTALLLTAMTSCVAAVVTVWMEQTRQGEP